MCYALGVVCQCALRRTNQREFLIFLTERSRLDFADHAIWYWLHDMPTKSLRASKTTLAYRTITVGLDATSAGKRDQSMCFCTGGKIWTKQDNRECKAESEASILGRSARCTMLYKDYKLNKCGWLVASTDWLDSPRVQHRNDFFLGRAACTVADSQTFAVDYGAADFDLGTSMLGLNWTMYFFIS